MGQSKDTSDHTNTTAAVWLISHKGWEVKGDEEFKQDGRS